MALPNHQMIKIFVESTMVCLAVYGLICDLKCNLFSWENNKHKIKRIFGEIIGCVCFAGFFLLPALLVYDKAGAFVFNGFLSSIMSFGGGDAYLTVADGLFVQEGYVTETEFYNSIVPIVNILPGSILCKTLSAIGYCIGGFWCAMAGFAVSVAASCGVFRLVEGLYESFEYLNIFQIIKNWIRPIVSGLLINVMLSLLVQAEKIGKVFTYPWMWLVCILVIYLIDLFLYNKFKWGNGKIALLSCVVSLSLCNIFCVL